MRSYLIIVNITIFVLLLILAGKRNNLIESGGFSLLLEEKEAIPYRINNPSPSILNYHQLIVQLNEWHKECPENTEIGTYGKSSGNRDLVYFRINPSKRMQPVILATGTIHGNELYSTAMIMDYIGRLLVEYQSRPEIKELLDNRDLYFIPVVSPDSYQESRYVDGVDPNRDFSEYRYPERDSCIPIERLKEFFLKIKPAAAISGHSNGQVFLYPYGDTSDRTPDDAKYRKILSKMTELSGYKKLQLRNNYGYPIFGTEADWYYRHGCFSLVIEFGEEQKTPNDIEILSELNKTYESFVYFLSESVK
jgi:hypothetical protein